MTTSQYQLPPPPQELPAELHRWFQLVYARLRAANVGTISFTDLNFTGGDLTEIPTRNHNDLQAIQGGSPTDIQHLTTAQVTDLAANTSDIATIKAEIAAGLTVIITTAKLTAGGVNGSMTFTNGILTAQTAAT
jgi:hypothetical protein